MKVSLIGITASVVACTLSGFVGAYFATRLFVPSTPGFLRLRNLEIVDNQQRVRGVLSAGDGKVSLRMFSKHQTPILECRRR